MRPQFTIEAPEKASVDAGTSGHWVVTVYDNDANTFDEVILILMIATGCLHSEAEMETWEVHHLGRSVVHHSAEAECRRVAEIIGSIGIRVEATPEP